MQPNYEDPDPDLDRRLEHQRATGERGTIVIVLMLVLIGLCIMFGWMYE